MNEEEISKLARELAKENAPIGFSNEVKKEDAILANTLVYEKVINDILRDHCIVKKSEVQKEIDAYEYLSVAHPQSLGTAYRQINSQSLKQPIQRKERGMTRKVWYKAIDPYYSDQVHTFIGASWGDLDEQEYEFDKWLGREHPAGISFIYDKITIYESDCSEIFREIHAENYKKYLASKKEP